jgi:hypothetical protein
MKAANSKLKMSGRFYANVYRDGELIHKDEIGSPNIVTDEGLNHMLSVAFNQGTPNTTWYIAPFLNDITPLATDTAAGIVARAGETEAYDETNRVEWDEQADLANVKMSNDDALGGVEAKFTMNASVTVRGAMLMSAIGKSAVTGVCMAVAKFGTARALIAADELVVTYEIAATST